MERWDELQSFVKHGATPEVAALVALVNPETTESTEIMRYEIASEARV
jgi:quinol monooxygenase YgiN